MSLALTTRAASWLQPSHSCVQNITLVQSHNTLHVYIHMYVHADSPEGTCRNTTQHAIQPSVPPRPVFNSPPVQHNVRMYTSVHCTGWTGYHRHVHTPHSLVLRKSQVNYPSRSAINIRTLQLKAILGCDVRDQTGIKLAHEGVGVGSTQHRGIELG